MVSMCKNGWYFRLLLAVSGMLMAVLLSESSFASKGPVYEDASGVTGQSFAIPEGKYLYQFTWNGIPSAESELTVTVRGEETRPYYQFEGTARTSKFVDIFWRLRASMVAFVDVVTGRTVKIEVRDQQNRKEKMTETVFNYETSEAYYTRWKKGKKKEKTIELGSGTLDPASLCLLICQQKMQVGDTATLTLLVEDDPYEMQYSVTGRERIVVAGYEFDALRIEPTFRKLEDEGKNKEPKLTLTTLWVSESEPRIPLKMRSKTFVGHVTAELVGVAPA